MNISIFSERLKELRSSFNLTQEELAKKINISQASIVYWEQGKNTPKLEYIILLANFFNVTMDYLAGREDDIGIVEVHSELERDEKNLIDAYRQMDSAEKSVLNGYADVIINRHKKDTKDGKKYG